MIRGTDKPFVQGSPYKFPKDGKSDAPKPRICSECGKYKQPRYYEGNSMTCTKCEQLNE